MNMSYPIVSTSVFRFASSYRNPAKYGYGLLTLAEAVRTHLPGFKLRVFYDASVDAPHMRTHAQSISHKDKAGAAALTRAASTWQEVFSRLCGMTHVQLVRFHCPRFFDVEAGCHVDLFGTVIRLLPLFSMHAATHSPAHSATHASSSRSTHSHAHTHACAEMRVGGTSARVGSAELPAWVGGPVDGQCVFVADADFTDYAVEHGFLHMVRWYANMCTHDHGPSGGHVHAEGGGKAGTRPNLLAASSGPSTALRHLPECGLPALIANCVVTNTRFPLAWFTRVWEDAHSGGATLLRTYSSSLHAPHNRNHTYEKRNVGSQRSVWPFGVDEFLLTLLKPCAIGTADRRMWQYVIMPNVDIMVIKVLGLLDDALKKATPAAVAHVRCIAVMIAKLLNDDAAVASLQKECAAGDLQSVLSGKRSAWSGAAEQRVGQYTPLAEKYTIVGEPSNTFRMQLSDVLQEIVETVHSGSIPASTDDLTFLISNMDSLRRGADGLLTFRTFRLGGGRVDEVDDAGWSSELASCMQHIDRCGVIPPKGLPYYEPKLKPSGTGGGTVLPSCALPDPVVVDALPSSGDRECASQWTRVESRSNPGKFYWYNEETQETSWVEPAGLKRARSSEDDRQRSDYGGDDPTDDAAADRKRVRPAAAMI